MQELEMLNKGADYEFKGGSAEAFQKPVKLSWLRMTVFGVIFVVAIGSLVITLLGLPIFKMGDVISDSCERSAAAGLRSNQLAPMGRPGPPSRESANPASPGAQTETNLPELADSPKMQLKDEGAPNAFARDRKKIAGFSDGFKKTLDPFAPQFVSALSQHAPKRANTAGLLPMKLDLPLAGRPLLFQGLDAPVRVRFDYMDWRGQAQRDWRAFALGALAAALPFAKRRPWRATAWAALVLTFFPLCVWASWTDFCNALLSGWLVVFALQLFAARFVYRQPAAASRWQSEPRQEATV